ncbi:S-layer homology domain-containing protein [Bacillus salitolerans]|uniref:S-layer homology domain-containing protein n=1 Tax=Bacillus salitolerans TaxID=1437434 RepID=A0ABW4LM04_9BACI
MKKQLTAITLSLGLLSATYTNVLSENAFAQQQEQVLSFSDIPESYWAFKEIQYLKDNGIVEALEGNNFMPNEVATRGKTARMLVKALKLDTNVGEVRKFDDLKSTHPDFDYIQTAVKANIFSGKDDGTFGADDPLTRAQMAKVIVNAFNLQGYSNKDFKDIPKSDWAYSFTSILRHSGVTTGYEDNTFKPNNPNSRAQLSAFIYRALTNEQVDVIPTTDYKKMSLEQLRETYGDYKILYRKIDEEKGIDEIVKIDMVERLYNYLLSRPNTETTPEEYLKQHNQGSLSEMGQFMDDKYPYYDVFVIGEDTFADHPETQWLKTNYGTTPIRQLKLFPDKYYYLTFDYQNFVNNILPTRPNSEDGVLIDIQLKSKHFPIYTKANITTDEFATKSYKVNQIDMIDGYSLYKNFGNVELEASRLVIEVNGHTLSLTNGDKQATLDGNTIQLSVSPEIQNGTMYVPVLEVSNKLGLYTRSINEFFRIEVSNQIIR